MIDTPERIAREALDAWWHYVSHAAMTDAERKRQRARIVRLRRALANSACVGVET